MSRVLALILTLRPHQWVKNLFVAAPLVFAKRLTDVPSALTTLAAVAAFCALSGAVYALNDVVDVHKDRAHPTKQRRPVASGALPERTALLAALVLILGGLGVSVWLGWRFAAVASGYLILNGLYSYQLKKIAFLDVGTIALGFLLRVLAGAFAIDVPASEWLLACTALLAAFLGFGKRAHELAQAERSNGGDVGRTRRVLESYKAHHLRIALYILGLAAFAAYAIYTRTEHTIRFFDTEWMVLTTPFCAVGIWRFLTLATRSDRLDGPTEAMLRDVPFMLNLALWGAAVLAIIYFL
jgi:4-hydroxybenzoate polyprenyltransferase